MKDKELVMLIEWVVPLEDTLREGTEDYLDYLRQIGSAEIISTRMRKSKEDKQ